MIPPDPRIRIQICDSQGNVYYKLLVITVLVDDHALLDVTTSAGIVTTTFGPRMNKGLALEGLIRMQAIVFITCQTLLNIVTGYSTTSDKMHAL